MPSITKKFKGKIMLLGFLSPGMPRRFRKQKNGIESCRDGANMEYLATWKSLHGIVYANIEP